MSLRDPPGRSAEEGRRDRGSACLQVESSVADTPGESTRSRINKGRECKDQRLCEGQNLVGSQLHLLTSYHSQFVTQPVRNS